MGDGRERGGEGEEEGEGEGEKRREEERKGERGGEDGVMGRVGKSGWKGRTPMEHSGERGRRKKQTVKTNV